MLERRDEGPPHLLFRRNMSLHSTKIWIILLAWRTLESCCWSEAFLCFRRSHPEGGASEQAWLFPQVAYQISIICLMSPQHFYSTWETLISGCSGSVSAEDTLQKRFLSFLCLIHVPAAVISVTGIELKDFVQSQQMSDVFTSTRLVI